MISWVTSLFDRKQRTCNEIINRYWFVANIIGGALATLGREREVTLASGWCFDIEDPELYHWLDELEVAYAELGYRIIPLQYWIDFAGWNVSLDHLWLMKRKEGERPLFTKFEDRPELPQRHPLAD